MRFQVGDTVEPRAGFGGAWEGSVGVVERVTPNGQVLDVRFPGERYPIPFALIELRPSQQKLPLYP